MKKSNMQPYLDHKFQEHNDQLNLDSFISHLGTLYRLHPDKNGIYFKNKDWRYEMWHYNMLCINSYLLKLEMMHTDSDAFNEKNKNIKALIQGLQFFVVNLMTYKNLPILSVVIETFKHCLETIESKASDGQVNLTSSLLVNHRNFIKYLNNVPELQKKLDEVNTQIKSEEKLSIFHERLQSLKAQQSNILKLLYPSTFDARNLSINLSSLAQSEGTKSFENNNPPDSPLFFF